MIVSASTLGRWMGQVTTGHGFAVVAGTVTSVLTGAVSWPMAIPALIGGGILMLWPEQTGVANQAQTAAALTEKVAQAIVSLGLPPAPAPVASSPVETPVVKP